MSKSKADVERRLQDNREDALENADHSVKKFQKSTISRESAKLSGTGKGYKA